MFMTEIEPINIIHKRHYPRLYTLVIEILAIVGGTVATIGIANSLSHFIFAIKWSFHSIRTVYIKLNNLQAEIMKCHAYGFKFIIVLFTHGWQLGFSIGKLVLWTPYRTHQSFQGCLPCLRRHICAHAGWWGLRPSDSSHKKNYEWLSKAGPAVQSFIRATPPSSQVKVNLCSAYQRFVCRLQ